MSPCPACAAEGRAGDGRHVGLFFSWHGGKPEVMHTCRLCLHEWTEPVTDEAAVFRRFAIKRWTKRDFDRDLRPEAESVHYQTARDNPADACEIKHGDGRPYCVGHELGASGCKLDGSARGPLA